MNDGRETWMAFLNPDVVRAKLISAGLFLVAHEMLFDSIKRHPLEFFATRWTVRGPEQSARYKSKVLALDPKGKGDVLRGSIAWLRTMDVISEADEEVIRATTEARNSLAHEMTAMLGGSEPPEFVEHFSALRALTEKIEKWSIVNVEIATNPDYDGKEIVENDVMSGSALIMHLLAQAALGPEEEAWEFHRQFHDLWPDPRAEGR